MTRSFVYAAARTPFGRFGGALAGVRPDDLAATALSGVLSQVGDLDPQGIGDVVWGSANQAGKDNRNVGRMAASRTVETGDADVVVAGGVESMTRAPCVLPKPPRAAIAGAGIRWDDVAAVELDEAFAVQSLACIDAWKIDPEIVDARGGAIAIGHPLGASGGRVLGTLAKRLVESGDRWGVAAICIGVGQGLAVVLENVS